MSRKKYYSPEFKQEAVRLAEASGNKSQVARDLGIHATVIGKWQRQLQAEADAARGRKHFQGTGSLEMKSSRRADGSPEEEKQTASAGSGNTKKGSWRQPRCIFVVRS